MKYIWLLIPCIIAVATPFYNAIDPKLAGIPLFFWFQLVMVPLSAFFIFLAYRGDKQ